MKLLIFAGLLLGLFLGAAQLGAEEKKGTPSVSTSNEVAVIKTSEGEMVIEFWTDGAPKTVENFKKLARSGFYDGTTFHRIVKGFMIQGGDPLTKDPSKESEYGTGNAGYKIKAEFNDHSHERGVISMARSSDPDSAGSQFFMIIPTSAASSPWHAAPIRIRPVRNFSSVSHRFRVSIINTRRSEN